MDEFVNMLFIMSILLCRMDSVLTTHTDILHINDVVHIYVKLYIAFTLVRAY